MLYHNKWLYPNVLPIAIVQNKRKRKIMNHTKINSRQRINAFLRDLIVGGTFLLVTLVLGALGHWDLALPFDVMVILFSIILLTNDQLHRTEDGHRPQPFLGFFPRLFPRSGDPLRMRAEYEPIGQEEDFKPFVFKDRPEDASYE
jgi:hypothetical protein